MNIQAIKNALQPDNRMEELVPSDHAPVDDSVRPSYPNQRKGTFKLMVGSSAFALLLVVGLVASQTNLLQNQDKRSQASITTTVQARFSSSELSVVAGESSRTQVFIEPQGETNPTAAEIVLSYDPNALEITELSAGRDFSTVLVGAKNDDQSGVASITVARPLEQTQRGLELSAVSVAFRVKPGSTNTQLRIDTASQVAAEGSDSNVLQGTQVLRIIATQSAEARQEVRDNVVPVEGVIETPLRSPIVVPVSSPKATARPEPSYEPIPPQI